MNVNANRLELLHAAKQAASVAPNITPLEVLKGILLQAGSDGHLNLSATNLEIAICVGLPCISESEDAVVVNARLLVGMLERLGGETVTLSRCDTALQLTVRSDTTYYQIPIMGSNCFPQIEMPFPEDTIPVTGLPKMVRRIAFAVDKKNKEKPMLRCVNLMFTKDGLKAAGSDGCCVATAKGDEKSTGDVSMMVPASSLETLARISSDKDVFQVGTTGKNIVFTKKDLFFSARIQKLYEYPKIKQKIKLLRFELENHKPVSAEDMLETMCFAKGDGTGHNSGAVSNRTLYIAMNYQCAADAANSESSKEILNRLIPLEKEASRIEYYLSFLQENEKTHF